jgi:UPF0271 protein
LDLNADIAEYDDIDSIRAQEPFYRHISSANIACGGHAGTFETMREALELCALRRVSPGAHPSYPDRIHFGRVSIAASEADITQWIVSQTMALIGVGASLGIRVRHVKLHGALYHDCATSPLLARAAVRALGQLPPGLRLVGPPGCALSELASDAGIPYTAEGFADRRYDAHGRLLPRSRPNAVISDPAEAASQALTLSASGLYQTICVHADHEGALERLIRIHQTLTEHGIAVEVP